jgi:hypothetical protein
MKIVGEIVAGIAAGRLDVAGQAIRSADTNYFCISLITLQQLFAKTEEREMGHTIIFEYDRAGDVLENGFKSARDPSFAAEVLVGIDPSDVALPRDVVTNLPGLLNQLVIVPAVGPRTITNHEQLSWARRGDSCQDTRRDPGTIENEEGDGSFT